LPTRHPYGFLRVDVATRPGFFEWMLSPCTTSFRLRLVCGLQCTTSGRLRVCCWRAVQLAEWIYASTWRSSNSSGTVPVRSTTL
jgi:hypothetical protein